MDKRKFIKKVSERTGKSQVEIQECFEPIIQCIMELLVDGDELRVSSFGTIYTQLLPERDYKHPKTNLIQPLEERLVVKFKASDILLNRINLRISENKTG